MAFQELLRAATTISNTKIREEDISYLLTHRTEFETAFAKLYSILGSPPDVIRSVSAAPLTDEIPAPQGLPSSPAAEQHPSISEILPHNERSAPIPTRHNIPIEMEAVPDSVRKVLGLLDKKKKAITVFTYGPETHLDICPDYNDEDFRLTVIAFVSQKRTEAHYYRAGHAAVSLANSFLLWQGRDGSRTRLDILLDNINDQGGGCYREYADTCPTFRDKKRAAEYIEVGIRFLFFEQLLLVRSKGPTTCPDSDTLISTRASSVCGDPPGPKNTSDPVGRDAVLHEHAVVYPLFFVWRAFYRCRYRDLPALANALLLSQFWGEWTEKEDWHELINPLFPGITPPIEYAAHTDKRKRTPTVQSSKKKRKRHRTGQSTPHPSECSSVRGIPPDHPRIFPDQVPDAPRDIWPLGSPVFRDLQQDTQARDVWPLGSPLFRDPQQDAPARNVWPLGSPVFPDQPQDITGRNIYPVGSMVFPENVQSISTSDPLTPCGLHLSTPDLASEVANVLRNLATATGNQTGIANEA
ncbi:hypothetical protein BJX62DRAFT_196607 [Aspergillus germanicus]